MTDTYSDTDTYLGEEAVVTRDVPPAESPAALPTSLQTALPSAPSWTDERVELLRKLWIEGLSASRIAAELAGGVTRNAVIGKVHRLGLSGRVKAIAGDASGRARPNAAKPDPTARPPVAQGVAAAMLPDNAVALHVGPLPLPQIRRAGDAMIPLTGNVTIMDLRESMCRWPVGDPSSTEFRYCGSKAPIGGGPYCAHHSRMAYQPVQDRNRRKIA